jgi:hypothetical protein
MRTTTAAKKATTKATILSRKTEEVTIQIPRQHFEAFSIFANHFGLTPEIVMEHGIVSQLGALGDSALSALAFFDTLPTVVNPVFVTLKFVPEAHALLVLVARLIRRPLEKLAADLLHQDALCYLGDMENATKNGGFDNHGELVGTARRVIESEFEARRGRMVKCSQGNDAWIWTELESLRPSRLGNRCAQIWAHLP